jgi:hypothetical protein
MDHLAHVVRFLTAPTRAGYEECSSLRSGGELANISEVVRVHIGHFTGEVALAHVGVSKHYGFLREIEEAPGVEGVVVGRTTVLVGGVGNISEGV